MRMVEKPLFSAKAIARRVSELGADITRDYAGRDPLLVGVLKGSAFLTADLARAIGLDIQIEFVRARSYAGTESTGRVELSRAEDLSLAGRHVIIVEDIVDTGRTLAALLERLGQLHPASLAVCTLLDKPSRRVVDLHPDYTGFVIKDRFVVGYGLDHDERFRHLPAIHVLG